MNKFIVNNKYPLDTPYRRKGKVLQYEPGTPFVVLSCDENTFVLKKAGRGNYPEIEVASWMVFMRFSDGFYYEIDKMNARAYIQHSLKQG